MKIIIINGPNLNLLGKREPSIYGQVVFEDYFVDLKEKLPDVSLEYFQSNQEGKLIDKLHEVGFSYDGIIINAGAYTHTSIALGDAIKSIKTPVVEVHISNTHSREEFRRLSFISANVKGTVLGFGLGSYELGIRGFLLR